MLPHSGAGWALRGSLLYIPHNSQDCLWSVEPHRHVCTLQILQQNIFLKTFAVFLFFGGGEGVFFLLFWGFFFCKLYFCIFNCYFKILMRLFLLITLFLRKKKKQSKGGEKWFACDLT